MTIEKTIDYLKDIKDIGSDTFKIFLFSECITPTTQTKIQKCLDIAIRSLEMQKKLSEFSGMDICRWVEDYDYDEENISEYEFETSVDDFLIDEVNKETEEGE